MWIRPIRCLAVLCTALVFAACDRSSPSPAGVSNDGANPPPPPVAAAPTDSSTAPDQTVSAQAEPTTSPHTETWTPPDRGSRITAEQAHHLLSETVKFNPGSIQSSGIPVKSNTPLQVGDDLQVKEKSNWWAATIRGIEPDGRVRIHYFGWADSHDELKTRAELQLDPSSRIRAIDHMFTREGRPAPAFPEVGPDDASIDLELAPQVVEFEGFINYGSPVQTTSTNALGQPIANVITPSVINQPIFSTRKVGTNVAVFDDATVVLGGLVREDVQNIEDNTPPAGPLSQEDEAQLLSGNVIFNPSWIPSSGTPVQPYTPLTIGQDLQVKWGNTWWAATVRGFEPDGQIRIHYFGWADSYDEVKPRAELQLDPHARLRAIERVYPSSQQ